MKKIISIFFVFASLISLGKDKPADIAKQHLLINFTALTQEIEQLVLLGLSDQMNWQQLENQFFASRLAYKKIELLLTYLDREYIKDHINGAPLLHTERKAPDLVVLEPTGFQIMEEVLMEQDTEEFQKLSELLLKDLERMGNLLPSARLNDRMLFEAMREEIVRLAAMGITGFDSPSTKNTLLECQEVIRNLAFNQQLYAPYLSAAENTKYTKTFAHSTTFFAATDYNLFDRFGFIQEVLNPLYRMLLLSHQKLSIETKDLVFKNEFSVNYLATNIFDTDFLNYAYFSSYSNSGDQVAREQLGKLLFFDPLLSTNNERACASCHHPNKAFSDGQKTSTAFNHEGVLTRNSPGLINSIYNTRLFWDARATTPEEQVEHVLFNPQEFNSNYDEVAEKLKSCSEYVTCFDKAYPTIKNINRYTIVASISAYLQSLRSYNSPFDLAVRNEVELSSPNLRDGFNVFAGKGKCATCHFIPTFAGNVPPLYIDTETEVLGIPSINDRLNALLDSDLGRYANGRPQEAADFNRNSFKTPTLRNIALTAPYMHNGVFNTLREVVDYYNIGGGHGWGIAPENTTLGADSLFLTETEIDALIFFMESLTDTVGMTSQPTHLPVSNLNALVDRPIGGLY